MLDKIHSLPLEQKIGQLFFIGLPGPAMDAATRDLLEEIAPGGICLFARNLREAGQTRALLDEARAALPFEPFLSLDQEGGLVDRLRRVLEPMPAVADLKTEDQIRRLARITAESVRMLGFNLNFAPVVDVVDEERRGYVNGLVSRTFGGSKEDVARLAGVYLETLQAHGCLGCVKHFPGLGASEVDSHEELPLVNVDRETLETVDLYPYRELVGSGHVHLVMAAHAAFPAVGLQETDQGGKLLPSSLSFNFISGLLRRTVGFGGLVLTDDLEMGAIVRNYPIGEACRMAIAAGEDMLLICSSPDAIRQGFYAVLEGVRSGEIAEDAVDICLQRIAAAKNLIRAPLPFEKNRLHEISGEIKELKAELQ